ncbi:MAG: hypothetical protein NTV62_02480, partial [Candidatus Gribaldobacteria bacterium]|nr:hypothetical protein [Candidatus Gribaldobacteria bacterium]
MINLLPQTIKKELSQVLAYKRIVLVALFLALTLFILGGFLFYLQKTLAERSLFFQNQINIKQKKLESTQLKDFRSQIQKNNTQLVNVNQVWGNQTYFYPVLERFFALIPSEIYLKSLSLQKVKIAGSQPSKNKNSSNKEVSQDALIQIGVEAFALSRDSLVGFLEKLKVEPSFQGVVISSTAWLKPIKIDFS